MIVVSESGPSCSSVMFYISSDGFIIILSFPDSRLSIGTVVQSLIDIYSLVNQLFSVYITDIVHGAIG